LLNHDGGLRAAVVIRACGRRRPVPVLGHRHFLGAALQVERRVAPRASSQRPSVWRSSLRRCEKATVTSSTAAPFVHRLRVPGSGCMRTTAESTRGGGSKASGGTSSTDSIS
jgi:hypothetical protein